MCGFAGEQRWDGRPADVETVARMAERLQKRGPDGSGVWASGNVAFAHRRLKIIDLSEAGSQPMVDSELGLSLVFNGCIYNYEDLRSELEVAGHRFFSHSDTEVILKAWAQWGPKCVDRFMGMFAFALSERDSGRLILGRDRLGIKPLYLAESGERLRFASSLPALLAGKGVDTSLDPVALHHYLSFHSVVPAPRTILNGVRKLPPATVRTYEPDGTFSDHRYWNPSYTRRYEGMDARDWAQAVQDKLRVAVERRTVADVPVGVLLSGGLDSSLVVALLAESGHTDLRTFSIGFDSVGDDRGDEFVYSDLIAKHFGTSHSRIKVESSRLLPGVDAAIAAMSEPMVSHDAVAFYLLSEDVSKQVKVVQSGQGADEVFAGYDWYPPLADVPRDEAVGAYSAVFVDRPHADLLAMVRREWWSETDHATEFVSAHMAQPDATSTLDAALRLDTSIMLVDDPVKRVDNMTMAWGLEARVPFLDHELVELAAACPPELKLAQGGKGVLKSAARGLVPDEVIDRPKGYFPVPAIRYLHGPYLAKVREALTGPVGRARGVFRDDYVDALLEDPNTTRTTLGSNALWQVALLEMWLQEMGV
jgi:asparagine synthase (glutamine-hydrolysing)